MIVELDETELDESESNWSAERMIAELVAEVERLQTTNVLLLEACQAIIADQDSNVPDKTIDRDEEKAGCKCPYCQAVRLCRAAVAMVETAK